MSSAISLSLMPTMASPKLVEMCIRDRYKLMAFVTSAVLAGAAGALYAMNYSSVAAKKFDFNASILVLVFVVLGGLGNIRGSVIAAAFLTVLPEFLRNLGLDKYRMLVYAIVLIVVMIATNNENSKEFFAAVSYTHLDVYKRQTLYPADFNLSIGQYVKNM